MFLDDPSPFFFPLFLSPLLSGYCQFVLYFQVSDSILLIWLFCCLSSTYSIEAVLNVLINEVNIIYGFFTMAALTFYLIFIVLSCVQMYKLFSVFFPGMPKWKHLVHVVHVSASSQVFTHQCFSPLWLIDLVGMFLATFTCSGPSICSCSSLFKPRHLWGQD